MAYETAQSMNNEVMERLRSIPEVRKLEERIPKAHRETLRNVTLRRALRLYGDKPEVLADELRIVRACIPKDEADFPTLLEGAFVEMPEKFTFKPKLAEADLDSRLAAPALSKQAYGVHAVNLRELEEYFRNGGVFPHYRPHKRDDGTIEWKWTIEVLPYPRCLVRDNKRGKPIRNVKQEESPIDDSFLYQINPAELDRFLVRLGRDDAKLLRMRYGLGCEKMSFGQIGNETALSKGIARYHTHRALGKLHNLMNGHSTEEKKGKCLSPHKPYQRDQYYVDIHRVTGYLASIGKIRRFRDDYFGRLKLEQADELYTACVRHFEEGDGNSHSPLKEILTQRFGKEEGGDLFQNAMNAIGVRIEFNHRILHYFRASVEGSGSLVLDCNHVLPFDAIHSIKFNPKQYAPQGAQEFRKLLAQPAHPRSIFRMYLR